ncbi:MAG: hypothetical protein EOP53_06300 [Sphingobacteriales bacterium]|nr:MAG: hypothetical protein EOP53_06300 [Sphingobacteriales bacterium]
MKKHPEHKIDELLQHALRDLQGETSADDWAEIQRRLQKRQKDKPWFWFIRSASGIGVIAILLLVSAGISYNNFYKPETTHHFTNSVENKKNLAAKIENEIITNSAKSTKIIAQENELNISGEGNVSHENLKQNSSKKFIPRGDEKIAVNQKHDFFAERNKKQNQTENRNNYTVENQLSGNNKANKLVENISSSSIENQLVEAENSINDTTKKPDSNNTILTEIKNAAGKKLPKIPGANIDSKFSFGIKFIPNSGGRNLEFNPEKLAQTHKNYFNLRNSQESGNNGLQTGIFAQYNIWKGLHVQSGIEYNRQSEKAHYKFYNNNIPVVDSASREILGYIEIDDTIGTSYSGKNTYSYASIPVNIGYEFPLGGKLSFGLQAGGSAMFLLQATGKTLAADNLTLTEISNLRKTNFNIHFSPAIYYRFQKCFSIGLEANYSQLLNPVQNIDATIQTKPWNIGAGINLRFSPFQNIKLKN